MPAEVELFQPHDKKKSKVKEVEKEYSTFYCHSTQIGNKVYISECDFSSELAVYDTLKRSFVGYTEPLPVPLRAHAITAMDDKVYICGGQDRDGATTSNCVYLDFDGQWYSTPNMKHRRAYACAAAFDNQLFVFGGQGADCGKLSSVEVLDPMDQQWVTCSSMRKRRVHAKAAVLGKYICVVGGRLDGNGSSTACEMYYPRQDKWFSMCPLCVGRSGHELVVLDGRLYAIGGIDTYDRPLDSVEVYDDDRDEWEICAKPTNSEHTHFAAAVISGGQKGSSSCTML